MLLCYIHYYTHNWSICSVLVLLNDLTGLIHFEFFTYFKRFIDEFKKIIIKVLNFVINTPVVLVYIRTTRTMKITVNFFFFFEKRTSIEQTFIFEQKFIMV